MRILTTFVDSLSGKTNRVKLRFIRRGAPIKLGKISFRCGCLSRRLMEQWILMLASYKRNFEMPFATFNSTAASSMAIQPQLKRFVITLKPLLLSNCKLRLLPSKPNKSSCTSYFFCLVLSPSKCLLYVIEIVIEIESE